MKVAVMFNLRLEPPGTGHPVDERTCEFDTVHTVRAIASALDRSGCQVTLIEATAEAPALLAADCPDIVFNMAEGLGGADREAQVPALLELMNIPHTGPGPWCAATTLNKRRTKEVLMHYGIPTPQYTYAESVNDLRGWRRFPAIVKPVSEGSSKGIWQSNVVSRPAELRRRVDELLFHYLQPVLVEEYIQGRELTVGMLGNSPRMILPVAEICFPAAPAGVWPIDSYEAKWIWNGGQNDASPVVRCPARLNRREKNRVESTALAAFKSLDCRDLARLDMRLAPDGTPYVIEVNALPGLIADESEESRYPLMARVLGFSFDRLIDEILSAAISRYGLRRDTEAANLPAGLGGEVLADA